MSDQMASLYEIDLEEGLNDGDPYATLRTRKQSLAALRERNAFDLVIIGGGLTGATLAHEAVLRGITVLLLEAEFFGAHAISWDVQFAHYLRSKPLEILRSRSALRLLSRHRAPHLVSDMPSDSHRNSSLPARVVRKVVALRSVDEALLIRETILAARQEGAVVISSVQPTYVEAESGSGCYLVGFTDRMSDESYEVRVGGIVVDPTCGCLPPSRMGSYVASHDAPRDTGVQTIYEVLPKGLTKGVPFASFELSDGSFISLAKRGLGILEVSLLYGKEPVRADAVDTIIQEACQEAGWNIQQQVSRRVIRGGFHKRYAVIQHRGVFTCQHRAPWDAFQSARTIVKTVAALTPEPRIVKGVGRRLLPGGDYACELDSFRATARAHGIPERTIELAIARWQGRVRYIAQFPNGLRELCPGVLRGEVDLSFVSDQAVTINDLIGGSLRLDTCSEWQRCVPCIEERLAILHQG
jgi:hypothetical protein